MNGLPNVIVSELEIHYRSASLRAATYGRGIWESDLVRPTITSVDQQEAMAKTEAYLLYPNPSKGIFALKDNQEKALQISLFDLQGRQVHQQILSKSIVHEFDLSHLNNGLYVMRILERGGELKQIRLQIKP
jgi:hypothetical protein